jgi:hypothetical protein
VFFGDLVQPRRRSAGRRHEVAAEEPSRQKPRTRNTIAVSIIYGSL